MTDSTLKLTAPASVYQQRRRRLAAALKRPLLILAGRPRARNYAANTYPFRAGSTYLYFGAPAIEGAAWLIEPGSDGDQGCRLLRPPSSFDDAVWMGEPLPDAGIAAAAGVSQKGIADVDALAGILKGRSAASIVPPCVESTKWLASIQAVAAGPDELQPIIDQRLIKDEHELTAMRNAAAVSVQAHLVAMLTAAPGRMEADVAAAMYAIYEQHRCQPSFTSGVTVRGEILHCAGYTRRLQAGQLLLVDAGAEEPGGYAADITRTFPVSGSFTGMQRPLYDAVLHAQRSAMAACVPGRRYRDVHDLSAVALCEGLVQAGLLRGRPADLAGRLAHTLFFTHGVGHLIGLDVHDMEDFGDVAGYAPGRTRRPEFGNKFLRLDRDLQPGMTVTIEPGFYVVPALWRNTDFVSKFSDVINRPAVDALLDGRFGGIRIEDTVHVRDASQGGPEVLTAALPTDAAAVAAIVHGERS